ncbi:DUF1284 domain-containing protein [Clostridium sp.]|uniref:DUF1284 domain-containing protein n=1 Tax=Clostridium sp. TaxID=1506 RepID=UPI00346473C9
MIKLRPHHLLCLQGYEGKGYDEFFTKNMDKIYDALNNDFSILFQLQTHNDSICECCPNKIDEFNCNSNEKIIAMDNKVLSKFNLKPNGVYNFHHTIEFINSKITYDIFENICGSCEWYDLGICKEKIFKK